MSMNLDRHKESFRKMYSHYAAGETDRAIGIKEFYDEYLAMMDLPAEFYLQTVRKVFQEYHLPQGKLEYRGRLVRPELIRRTALFTVEGERDDICSIGQTLAAHDLCAKLAPVPQAAPPAGDRRPLRRLQRQALGTADLPAPARFHSCLR